MKKAAIAVGILFLFCLVAANISRAESLDQLKAKCVAVALMMQAKGYSVSDVESGSLSQGERDVYQSRLYSGSEYVHIVAAESSVRDVDLYVYDENKELIAKDARTDNTPVVENTPKWTGNFFEVVKMVSGGGRYVYMRLYK